MGDPLNHNEVLRSLEKLLEMFPPLGSQQFCHRWQTFVYPQSSLGHLAVACPHCEAAPTEQINNWRLHSVLWWILKLYSAETLNGRGRVLLIIHELLYPLCLRSLSSRRLSRRKVAKEEWEKEKIQSTKTNCVLIEGAILVEPRWLWKDYFHWDKHVPNKSACII